MILNDGNGKTHGTFPVDRGYVMGYLYNSLTWDTTLSKPRVGTAGLMMEWLAKDLQANDLDNVNPYYMTIFPGIVSTWSELPASQTSQLMNAWVSTLLNSLHGLNTTQFFAEALNTTSTFVATSSFSGDLAVALPQLRLLGVDPSLLNQLTTWASGVWPGHDWNADLNETCTRGNLDAVFCQ